MTVKKITKTLVISGLMGLSVMSQANERVLNVYNWSDYIGKDTLEKFHQQTKIKVNYDVFDSNETLEAKLMAGNSGYDVVVPSANFMAKQIKSGIYYQLDKSKIPNYQNLDPILLKMLEVNDPGNLYGVPYLWGTIGFAYNVEKVKAVLGDNAPVDSWDLVFKKENISKLKECGVTFLDSPTEILPTAFKFLGIKPDTVKPTKEEMQKTEELFLSLRPYISYFHSSKYISDLANGNICVAVGYSGDLYQAIERAKEAKSQFTLTYSLPKEGAGTFFDILGITKDAKNIDEAHAFINFVLNPTENAAIVNEVRFSSGNNQIRNLVDKELMEDPNIFPSQEVLANLYTFPDLPLSTVRTMNRSWAKIKTGQ